MVRRAPSRRPSDAGPKNTKNPSLCWGRARVSKSFPPPFWGHLKWEKIAVWHIFRTMFAFRNRKKCSYLQCFCNFKKTWKARNTVNSSVLATFGCWNACIYAVFSPWRYQTLVNYSIFCTFWTDSLPCWTQKTLVLTRFSKNRRSWREQNPVNNSVLAKTVVFTRVLAIGQRKML